MFNTMFDCFSIPDIEITIGPSVPSPKKATKKQPLYFLKDIAEASMQNKGPYSLKKESMTVSKPRR
jgi:hypothetical protein